MTFFSALEKKLQPLEGKRVLMIFKGDYLGFLRVQVLPDVKRLSSVLVPTTFPSRLLTAVFFGRY